VLAISVVGGVLLAVLFDQPFRGRGIARLLVIGPFFVMPTVAALIWKNMIMHPVYGILAYACGTGPAAHRLAGRVPDAVGHHHCGWQWLPFAFLILLTAAVAGPEQKEAAQLDGAGPVRMFFYIVLPHLKRAITVVMMIETIFLLSVFAEIFTTTAGGPGTATTNLTFLIYAIGLQQFDVGMASAGGIFAVVLANIVSFFLVRMLASNLKENEK
jgi:sorbitol/mannitol transport system permease protein